MAQLVDLKVGFYCNNNCIHCVVSDHKDKDFLSFQEISKLINLYINQYQKIQLTLTGGEITIHPEFNKILQFIMEQKINNKITFVDMQTNGRMLLNDKKCILATSVIDFFLVALHSSRSDIHDRITRVEGSFYQTTQAISKIINLIGKDKLATQTVINKLNYTYLKDIYVYIHQNLHIKECNITFPHPIGVCNSTEIVPMYKDVQKYVNEALSYCLEHNIFPYIEALPLCIFKPGINRDYVAKFINEKNLNIVGYAGKKDGYIDYYKVFDEGHKKYESCKQCVYYDQCEGVWKEHIDIYPNENMYKLYMKGNS